MSVDLPGAVGPQDPDDPAPLEAEGDVGDREDRPLRTPDVEPLRHPLDEEGGQRRVERIRLGRGGQAVRNERIRFSEQRGGHGGWSSSGDPGGPGAALLGELT